MNRLTGIALLAIFSVAYCQHIHGAISPELIARDNVLWTHQRMIEQWYSESGDWNVINERYRIMVKIELELLNSLNIGSSEHDAARQAVEELYRYLERHSIQELKQYIDRKIIERCYAP